MAVQVNRIRLVIHGGCGLILKKNVHTEREKEHQDTLRQSLFAGYKVLSNGGSALDACLKAVVILENSPLYNAGKGAVFTTDLTCECDAGIQDGHSGMAGGVSTVTNVKNPILLAREVMNRTPHALLCGSGAEKFAASLPNMELVANDYFHTDIRRKQVLKVLESRDDKGRLQPVLDHSSPSLADKAPVQSINSRNCDSHHQDSPLGTVGAVALDLQGNLAAASSTGGMSGKMPGRVSDSAVVGAGFYASNSVALSATGNGDFFLRKSACRQAADMIEMHNLTIEQACDELVYEKLKDTHAGLIGLDSKGNITMPFNTPGMFRGFIDENESPWVAIWK